MKTPKIYISGKITGIEKEAPELFEAIETELKALGYHAVNPMKLNHEHEKTWTAYMREDLKALCECDAIFLINNWHNSKGAKAELSVAETLGLEIFTQLNQLRPWTK